MHLMPAQRGSAEVESNVFRVKRTTGHLCASGKHRSSRKSGHLAETGFGSDSWRSCRCRSSSAHRMIDLKTRNASRDLRADACSMIGNGGECSELGGTRTRENYWTSDTRDAMIRTIRHEASRSYDLTTIRRNPFRLFRLFLRGNSG